MALLKGGKIYQVKFTFNNSSSETRTDFLNKYIAETGITDEKYTTIYYQPNENNEEWHDEYFINLPYINDPIKDSNDNNFSIGLGLDFHGDSLYGIKNNKIITDYFTIGSCYTAKYEDSYHRIYYTPHIRNDNFYMDTGWADLFFIIDARFLDTHNFYTITLAGFPRKTKTTSEQIDIASIKPTIFVCDMIDQTNGNHCDGFFTLGAPLSEDQIKTKYIEGYVVQDGEYVKQKFIPQKYSYDGEFVLQKVQFGRFRSDNIYLTNAYNQIDIHDDFVINLSYGNWQDDDNGWLDDILYSQNKKFLIGRNLYCDPLVYGEGGTMDTQTYSYQYVPVIVKMKENKPESKGCLEFSSDRDFTLRGPHYWDGVIEYSIDNEKTWVEWDGSELSGSAEQNIYLRGTGNTKMGGSTWNFTGKYIKGNIETLLDYQTVLNEKHPVMSDFCFAYMFQNCHSLVEAPDLLMITLTKQCCYYMFDNCTSLIKAPKIAALNLAEDCCSRMFQGCTSLKEPPELPATTLAKWCYYYMFYNCTSLTQAPDLPATTLADYCYDSMFYSCTSLVEAPDLLATTLANGCYYYMFAYCTSLIKAPDLPATTLAEYCYSYMFGGCTSLTKIPELPATELKYFCYYNMFDSCRKVKISSTQSAEYPYEYRIPKEGTGISTYHALYSMFSDTGGTFIGTPTINTTYYTSNEVI